jgi:endonuclease/exonuclease/phosphatase family metal-dependent hydrolase
MTLRLLCYNIHGGRNRRGQRDLPGIRKVLEDHDIDVAVFQEMETRPSRGGAADDIVTIAGTERLHHLQGLVRQEEGGWYGNLIVSRHPILRGIVHNLDTAKHLEPRNAVDALIATPAGKLRVIGTHLSLMASMRFYEAQTLMGLIHKVEDTEPNPMLLMGDINEWRGGARLLRYLDEHLRPLPCRRTFPSYFPLFKLDRVWAHNFSRAVSVRRLDTPQLRWLSDHLPLLIEVPPQ